jgi:hypothetical protein
LRPVAAFATVRAYAAAAAGAYCALILLPS